MKKAQQPTRAARVAVLKSLLAEHHAALTVAIREHGADLPGLITDDAWTVLGTVGRALSRIERFEREPGSAQ